MRPKFAKERVKIKIKKQYINSFYIPREILNALPDELAEIEVDVENYKVLMELKVKAFKKAENHMFLKSDGNNTYNLYKFVIIPENKDCKNYPNKYLIYKVKILFIKKPSGIFEVIGKYVSCTIVDEKSERVIHLKHLLPLYTNEKIICVKSPNWLKKRFKIIKSVLKKLSGKIQYFEMGDLMVPFLSDIDDKQWVNLINYYITKYKL